MAEDLATSREKIGPYIVVYHNVGSLEDMLNTLYNRGLDMVSVFPDLNSDLGINGGSNQVIIIAKKRGYIDPIWNLPSR